jgi:hypothetical protein
LAGVVSTSLLPKPTIGDNVASTKHDNPTIIVFSVSYPIFFYIPVTREAVYKVRRN